MEIQTYPKVYGSSNDTGCLIALKVLCGLAFAGETIWTIAWAIKLGLEVSSIIVVPNVFIIAWSALYLFVPALGLDKNFKMAAKITSILVIVITAIMTYLIFARSSFGMYALIYVFYVGWIGTINSLTLLICLFVDDGSSPSLYEIMTGEREKKIQPNMFYYVLNPDSKYSESFGQPIKINSPLSQFASEIVI